MTSTGTPAARFIRVSGDTQDEKSQVRDCDTVAGANGLEFVMPDFQLHAVSGSKGDKRHLAALGNALAAIRSGTICALVVAHSSRLTRLKPDEADLFALQVRMAGGRIYSHDEPHYGAGDLMSKFSALMAHEQNHAYSTTQGDHINRKFRNEIDAGGWFRGYPPAGYAVTGEKYKKALMPATGRTDVPRKRMVNGEKAVIMVTLPSAQDVRDAFTDATTGTGIKALGKRLGVTPDAVAKMLRNPVYGTGRYEVTSHRDCPHDAACKGDGKSGTCAHVTVAHRCEPLVDPDVQVAAIAALEARHTGDNVTSRSLRDGKGDFSGAVLCGHCGGRMYRYFGGGRPRADGTPVPRSRRYKCVSCPKSVHADNADTAVHDLMSAQRLPWMRARLIPGNDNSAALDRVIIELRELGGRGMDEAAEDAERTRLRAERRRLEGLPSIPARTVTEMVTRADGAAITEGDHWDALGMAERREWLTGRDFSVLLTAAPGRTGAVIAEIERE